MEAGIAEGMSFVIGLLHGFESRVKPVVKAIPPDAEQYARGNALGGIELGGIEPVDRRRCEDIEKSAVLT